MASSKLIGWNEKRREKEKEGLYLICGWHRFNPRHLSTSRSDSWSGKRKPWLLPGCDTPHPYSLASNWSYVSIFSTSNRNLRVWLPKPMDSPWASMILTIPETHPPALQSPKVLGICGPGNKTGNIPHTVREIKQVEELPPKAICQQAKIPSADNLAVEKKLKTIFPWNLGFFYQKVKDHPLGWRTGSIKINPKCASI